jgi:hypothetical protein
LIGFWNPYIPPAVKILPRWDGLSVGLDRRWNIYGKSNSCLFGKNNFKKIGYVPAFAARGMMHNNTKKTLIVFSRKDEQQLFTPHSKRRKASFKLSVNLASRLIDHSITRSLLFNP